MNNPRFVCSNMIFDMDCMSEDMKLLQAEPFAADGPPKSCSVWGLFLRFSSSLSTSAAHCGNCWVYNIVRSWPYSVKSLETMYVMIWCYINITEFNNYYMNKFCFVFFERNSHGLLEEIKCLQLHSWCSDWMTNLLTMKFQCDFEWIWQIFDLFRQSCDVVSSCCWGLLLDGENMTPKLNFLPCRLENSLPVFVSCWEKQ